MNIDMKIFEDVMRRIPRFSASFLAASNSFMILSAFHSNTSSCRTFVLSLPETSLRFLDASDEVSTRLQSACSASPEHTGPAAEVCVVIFDRWIWSALTISAWNVDSECKIIYDLKHKISNLVQKLYESLHSLTGSKSRQHPKDNCAKLPRTVIYAITLSMLTNAHWCAK